MATSSRDRLTLVGILAAFLSLAGIAAFVLLPHVSSRSSATIGGPFTLTSQDGKLVTEHALLGHPTLVFFGYTHCPDVCPATLAQISSVFKELGSGNKAQAVFITVDPARDTPVVLKDYLTSFDPRVTALTGPPDAIKRVETEYKAYAKAVPDKDGTYAMEHTAITYLMDKDGEFVGAFNLDRPTKDAAAELKQYF
jgi:protein SCO1